MDPLGSRPWRREQGEGIGGAQFNFFEGQLLLKGRAVGAWDQGAAG